MTISLTYRGDGLPPDGDATRNFPYLADPGLVKAVNLAIHLGRPLLVKGPPGCGKTKVAAAVSHELGIPLHSWYVKSTSRARDGLYAIDVVRRLQDSQILRGEKLRLTPYLRFGPLGEALRSNAASVVLIDEIDKADIDFPNDLLRELDEAQFTIDELVGEALSADEMVAGFRDTYKAAVRPIVIVTSNDEKELPDAFLRRCIFHWIDFPEPTRLKAIVRVNMPDVDVDAVLVDLAIAELTRYRDIDGVRKKPETSELIDWVRILHHWGVDLHRLREVSPPEPLPHWEVLYKHQRDVQLVREANAKRP